MSESAPKERSAVIAFLIVTSIINLALGYALAVYLRQASIAATADTLASEMATPTMEPIAFGGRLPLPPADLTRAPSHVAIAADNSRTVDELQDRASEMEDELLAGIEDFRHQLSQLKGQRLGGEILNPLSVDAAS